MEPADSVARDWSITKAEWDGVGRSTRLETWINRSLIAVLLVAAVSLLAAPKLFPSIPRPIAGEFAQIIAIPLILFALLLLYSQLIALPRWERFRPVIWESRGCACPWCQVRVDGRPCPRHGFTRAHHAQLLDFWEATATNDAGRRIRAQRGLLGSAERKPLHTRLLWPITGVFAAYKIAANDPASTPHKRLRAALPWLALEIVGVALLALVAAMFIERRFVISFLSGCWPFIILTPLMAVIGPKLLRGRLRCSACDQACTTEQSTQCPECGADLTQPGAVTRVEPPRGSLVPILLVPLVLLLAAPYLASGLVSLLPASMRHAVYSATRPPYEYWQNLAPATMSAEEIAAAADLLITHAAPDGVRPLFDFDFLPNAIAAGTLGNDTLERAARAVVRARLEITQDDGRLAATVHPEFGALIFGARTTPRLVFGGVSVDGGPWSPPAAWSLFLHDTDSFWRANGQLRVLPEEMLVFRSDLGPIGAGELGPGRHAVRARCWIVLHGPAYERFAPDFDPSGALIPPKGATAYELMLEGAVTVK